MARVFFLSLVTVGSFSMTEDDSSSGMVYSLSTFSGMLGFGSSKIILAWTEVMVSSSSLLHCGESCSTSTSTSGCGCGDASIVSLAGLVAGLTDKILESRKSDQCM